jgi:hypothetical protein
MQPSTTYSNTTSGQVLMLINTVYILQQSTSHAANNPVDQKRREMCTAKLSSFASYYLFRNLSRNTFNPNQSPGTVYYLMTTSYRPCPQRPEMQHQLAVTSVVPRRARALTRDQGSHPFVVDRATVQQVAAQDDYVFFEQSAATADSRQQTPSA